MAFQAVPETVEIATIYDLGTVNGQMTFHGRLVGGYSTAELEDLADAVDARVVTSFLPIQTQDISYTKTVVRGLALENDQLIENSDGTGFGSVGSAALPNNVTFAVKRLSGFTGRSARGRVYWLGLATSQLDTDENFLTGAAALAVQGAIDNMRATIVSEGWTPVIVSRWAAGVKRTAGVTFTWVTTSKTNDRVDSRRDRLP